MGIARKNSGIRGRRRWLRLLVRLALIGMAVPALAIGTFLAVVLVPTIHDPTAELMERKGEVASARTTATWEHRGDVIHEVSLTSTSGLKVELSVRVPRGATSPRPLAILIAGRGTGRDAVRYTADTQGIVVAALSYPYQGDDDAGVASLLLHLPEIQRGVLDTIPAIMLAADWLIGQPYVDPEHLELAGGSLGAFFVSVPGAMDSRFRRVWLVHGGGMPSVVLAHGLREHVRYAPIRHVLAKLLATAAYGHHLAPEKWVGKISPRPVVVINAIDDESIPPASVKALHDALNQPFEVIWMSGGHVMPGRAEIIEKITDVVFARITEARATPSTPAEHEDAR